MLKKAFVGIALMMQLVMCGCSSGHSGTSKCTICGEKATHVFQGSGYCDEHYQDAVIWSMEHSK